jgi:hypothetical protein
MLRRLPGYATATPDPQRRFLNTGNIIENQPGQTTIRLNLSHPSRSVGEPVSTTTGSLPPMTSELSGRARPGALQPPTR